VSLVLHRPPSPTAPVSISVALAPLLLWVDATMPDRLGSLTRAASHWTAEVAPASHWTAGASSAPQGQSAAEAREPKRKQRSTRELQGGGGGWADGGMNVSIAASHIRVVVCAPLPLPLAPLDDDKDADGWENRKPGSPVVSTAAGPRVASVAVDITAQSLSRPHTCLHSRPPSHSHSPAPPPSPSPPHSPFRFGDSASPAVTFVLPPADDETNPPVVEAALGAVEVYLPSANVGGGSKVPGWTPGWGVVGGGESGTGRVSWSHTAREPASPCILRLAQECRGFEVGTSGAEGECEREDKDRDEGVRAGAGTRAAPVSFSVRMQGNQRQEYQRHLQQPGGSTHGGTHRDTHGGTHGGTTQANSEQQGGGRGERGEEGAGLADAALASTRRRAAAGVNAEASPREEAEAGATVRAAAAAAAAVDVVASVPVLRARLPQGAARAAAEFSAALAALPEGNPLALRPPPPGSPVPSVTLQLYATDALVSILATPQADAAEGSSASVLLNSTSRRSSLDEGGGGGIGGSSMASMQSAASSLFQSAMSTLAGGGGSRYGGGRGGGTGGGGGWIGRPDGRGGGCSWMGSPTKSDGWGEGAVAATAAAVAAAASTAVALRLTDTEVFAAVSMSGQPGADHAWVHAAGVALGECGGGGGGGRGGIHGVLHYHYLQKWKP
jgi:hypothetical protein